jgi:uracil-DNA glycosylase
MESTYPILIPKQLEEDWKEILKEEWDKPYLKKIGEFLSKERSEHTVYPPAKLVFNALNHTPFEKVNVVIVGQDPYHGPNQAHGLSFSVPKEVPLPPSLQNIFKELETDLGIPYPPPHGCLDKWADQGVLLLNAILTVRAGEPASHHGIGWEIFTDAIIKKLYEREDPVIFVLWGRTAQEKYKKILNGISEIHRHHILTAPHPSPFSAYSGFFGCHHFSKINEQLIRLKKQPIQWQL